MRNSELFAKSANHMMVSMTAAVGVATAISEEKNLDLIVIKIVSFIVSKYVKWVCTEKIVNEWMV